MKQLFSLILCFLSFSTFAMADEWTTIKNGEVWYDTNGDTIQAHAPGFLRYGDRWYMVGEDRGDSWNPDVNMYSSTDLVNWRFEAKVVKNGVTVPELGKTRFIERAKICATLRQASSSSGAIGKVHAMQLLRQHAFLPTLSADHTSLSGADDHLE